jgi:hypothetical protein
MAVPSSSSSSNNNNNNNNSRRTLVRPLADRNPSSKEEA